MVGAMASGHVAERIRCRRLTFLLRTGFPTIHTRVSRP